jgi:hypothetical protein
MEVTTARMGDLGLRRRRPARAVHRARLAALILVSAALHAGAVTAARPGTGYGPRARGLSQAHYYACLQYAGSDGALRPCPEIVKPLDPTADPYLFLQGTPEFVAAFERRWGRPDPSRTPPDPGSYRRKKWAFMDNERGGLARVVLRWACEQRPDLLGTTAGEWSCEPSPREELDFEALYDLPLLRAYFEAEVAGARPERPFAVSEPAKACAYSAPDPWWFGWTLHYKNEACRGPRVATEPERGAPAKPSSLSDDTVEQLRELRGRLGELARWIDQQLPPGGFSTARIGLGVVPGPAGRPHGGGKP